MRAGAGSGFYWEYDRLKSNLLLRLAPSLLNDNPQPLPPPYDAVFPSPPHAHNLYSQA